MRCLFAGVLVCLSASAATRTWDGSYSPYWSAAQNWVENSPPAAGDDLVFPSGAANLLNTNNMGSLNLSSITVSGNGYTLRSLTTIAITNAIYATYGTGSSTLELNLNMSADLVVDCRYSSTEIFLSGNIALGSHTLTKTGAGKVHLGGAIGGTGNVTKLGSGPLRLHGASNNTYSGVTTVNYGVVELDKVLATAIPSNSELIIGTGLGSAKSAIVQEKSDYQIADNANVTIKSDGWLDLGANDDTVGPMFFDGGLASSTVGSLYLGGNITVSTNGGTVSGFLGIVGTTRTLDVTSPGNLHLEAIVYGTGGILKSGTGFLTIVSSNSYSGTTTIQGGYVDVKNSEGLGSSTGGTILQGGTLRLTGVSVVGEALTASGGKLQGLNAISAWTGPVTLSGSITIEVVNAGQLLDLRGIIGGTGGFTKTGNGTLRLSGSSPNSYSGATILNTGVLELSKSGLVEAIFAGSLTIGDGIGGTDADIVRELFPHQIGSVPIRINDSGLLDLNGYYDYVSAITFDGGRIVTGAGLLALTENVTVLANTNQASRIQGRVWLPGTRTFDVANSIFFPDFAMSASVEGSGGIEKAGSGSMLLYSSNSYSGVTIVSDGLLGVYNSYGLGSTSGGTTVNSGGALVVNNDSHVPAEPLTLSGAGFSPYGALDSFTGTNSWAGDITLAADTRIRVMDAADSLELFGQIGGVGGLTLSGGGHLILSGSTANKYSGTTYVNSGTLRLRKTIGNGAIPGSLVIGDGLGGAEADIVRVELENQIDNRSAVTVNSSGLLQMTSGLADAIGLLSGNGNVDLGSDDLHTGYNDGSSVFSGVIRGSTGCELNKSGDGVFTLTGNNTYPGWTYVLAGTIEVLGSQPLSPVSVGANGTLNGTGEIGFLLANGNVQPGRSPGILTCSNANLAAAMDYYLEINGIIAGTNYDQLNVRGTNTLSSPFLHVSLGYMPAVGERFVIIDNDGTDPVFGTFAGLPEGASLTASNAMMTISYSGGSGNDVVLTVTNVTEIEPLRITGIKAGEGQVSIEWEGGVPFYVLEQAISLDEPVLWKAVTEPSREYDATILTQSSKAFYRVVGSQ